jgi:hypothetical protein
VVTRNRRRVERLPILGDLRAEIMVFQPMLIREISPVGATVETRMPLQLDSLHEVRLTLGGTAVVVRGRVVHCRINDLDPDLVAYQSGLAFVDLPPHVEATIRQFMERVREERSGV